MRIEIHLDNEIDGWSDMDQVERDTQIDAEISGIVEFLSNEMDFPHGVASEDRRCNAFVIDTEYTSIITRHRVP
jgi:hypothetical protein